MAQCAWMSYKRVGSILNWSGHGSVRFSIVQSLACLRTVGSVRFLFFFFFSPPDLRERPEVVSWLDRYRSTAPALSRSWIDRGYGRWAVVDRAVREVLLEGEGEVESDRGGRGTKRDWMLDRPSSSRRREPGLEEGFLAIDSPRQQAVRGVRAPRCKWFCPSTAFPLLSSLLLHNFFVSSSRLERLWSCIDFVRSLSYYYRVIVLDNSSLVRFFLAAKEW